MSRPLRVEFPGCHYHIFARSNDRKEIFLSDGDYMAFLKILSETCRLFSFTLFAYVLMPNHYHLLIRTGKVNLSRAMQWLGTTFTRRYNLHHKRNGHLFQGRFKSIVVQEDSYFLRLSCYIHRNPLRARLADSIENYRWSSYPYYVGRQKPPVELDTNFILSMVGGSDPKSEYRRIVSNFAREEKYIWDDLRCGFILGSEEFVNRIKSSILPKTANPDQPQLNAILKDVNPAVLAEKAAGLLGCLLVDLEKGIRIKRKYVLSRDLILCFLKDTGFYTNAEIGEVFGLSYSAVSLQVGLMKRRLTEDESACEKLRNLNSIIKV